VEVEIRISQENNIAETKVLIEQWTGYLEGIYDSHFVGR